MRIFTVASICYLKNISKELSSVTVEFPRNFVVPLFTIAASNWEFMHFSSVHKHKVSQDVAELLLT